MVLLHYPCVLLLAVWCTLLEAVEYYNPVRAFCLGQHLRSMKAFLVENRPTNQTKSINFPLNDGGNLSIYLYLLFIFFSAAVGWTTGSFKFQSTRGRHKKMMGAEKQGDTRRPITPSRDRCGTGVIGLVADFVF